jgi:hypothetical protein
VAGPSPHALAFICHLPYLRWRAYCRSKVWLACPRSKSSAGNSSPTNPNPTCSLCVNERRALSLIQVLAAEITGNLMAHAHRWLLLATPRVMRLSSNLSDAVKWTPLATAPTTSLSIQMYYYNWGVSHLLKCRGAAQMLAGWLHACSKSFRHEMANGHLGAARAKLARTARQAGCGSACFAGTGSLPVV